MKTIFFAGSFNPFTKGHADILKRLMALADKVVVGIGVNPEKPSNRDEALANAEAIRCLVEREGLADRVEIKVYTGLTAEEALRCGADVMARGIRSGTDFDYEYTLAAANRDAFDIDTILLPADPRLSFVSSSIVRDLIQNGRNDIAKNYLP